MKNVGLAQANSEKRELQSSTCSDYHANLLRGSITTFDIWSKFLDTQRDTYQETVK